MGAGQLYRGANGGGNSRVGRAGTNVGGSTVGGGGLQPLKNRSSHHKSPKGFELKQS